MMSYIGKKYIGKRKQKFIIYNKDFFPIYFTIYYYKKC